MALSSKPIIVVLVTLLLLIIPCNGVFAERSIFSSVPRKEENGRFYGVYVRPTSESCGQHSTSHKILQFYEDGIMLSASVCSSGDLLQEWRNISQWFHRNTDDFEIPRSEYWISQDQIHFRITVYDDHTGETIIVDYSGTYSTQQLVLDVYDHYHGWQAEDQVYFKLDVAD